MEALRKFCMKEVDYETNKNRNKVKILKQKPSFMSYRVKQSIMDTIIWAKQFEDMNESKTQIIARLTNLHGEGRGAV